MLKNTSKKTSKLSEVCDEKISVRLVARATRQVNVLLKISIQTFMVIDR